MKHEIDKLKNKLLSLCSMVEENVWRSVKSIIDRDSELARNVIENDYTVDQTEVDIEEECLKILALHQPVAIDLRFLITVLKLNNDLERIGDLAVNIAERSEFLSSEPPIDVYFDFEKMAEKTECMLKDSIDALVNVDVKLAYKVCSVDDEIDEMNRQMFEIFKENIEKNPQWSDRLLHLLSVSRHLERIADHATNIAEDVIYMIEGKIVRHSIEKYI